jgi:hypothetical protein
LPQVPPIALIAFGILGCSFLGFVVGLGGVVTKEYVDSSLSGNPLVREYDFRVGGKYEPITLFMLITGSFLAWTGNTMGLHMLYKGRRDKDHNKGPKVPEIVPSLVCPRCKRRIPTYSKFCPKCGTDIIE